MAFVCAKQCSSRGLPRAAFCAATTLHQTVGVSAMLVAGVLAAWPCSASARTAVPAQLKQQMANEQAPPRADAAATASSAFVVAFAEPPGQSAKPDGKAETRLAADRDRDEDDDEAVPDKPAAAPKEVTSPAQTAPPSKQVETRPAADRDDDEDDNDEPVTGKPPVAPKGARSPAQAARPATSDDKPAGSDDADTSTETFSVDSATPAACNPWRKPNANSVRDPVARKSCRL